MAFSGRLLTGFVLAPLLFFGAVGADLSGSVTPGETLRVEGTFAGAARPVFRWPSSTSVDYPIPFFPRDGAWVAFAPIPFDLSGESVTAEIADAEEGDRTLARRTFHITASERGFETLRFSDKKRGLLNDPSEDAESREIRQALFAARSDPERRWDGAFDPPVPGRVLSPFGVARNKVGQDEPDVHWGVDFRAAAGDPIRAPANAIVLLVRDYKFHGKTVLLSHGWGVGSIYIHLRDVHVGEGDAVKRGDAVGAAGASGLATAPHLHWGVYVQGKPVDPAQWLREEF